MRILIENKSIYDINFEVYGRINNRCIQGTNHAFICASVLLSTNEESKLMIRQIEKGCSAT